LILKNASWLIGWSLLFLFQFAYSAAPVAKPAPAMLPKPVPAAVEMIAECTQAVSFDPRENGVVLSKQGLEYSVSGNDVKIGTAEYKIEGVSFEINKDESGKKYFLKFAWPKGFMTEGAIIIQTDPDKKLLFKYPYNSTRGAPEYILTRELFESWQRDVPFRFCAVDETKDLKRSICSKDYVLHKGSNGIDLRPSKEKYENEVTINENGAPLKGLSAIDYGSVIDWKLRTSDGNELEILTRPVPFELQDFWQNKTKKTVTFVGNGGQPQDKSAINNEIWSVTTNSINPHLYFAAENNVTLRQDFTFNKPIPDDSMKLSLVTGSRKSSYLQHVPLHGCSGKGSKVSSKSFSATKTGSTTFDWDFKSETLANLNKSTISLLTTDSNEYVGNYSVFRGYPYEIAARVSAAFASQGALVIGELQSSAWVEQILSSENSTFSLLRWGASVGYITSFVAPTDPSSGQSLALSNLDAEIKYRFTPGIWNQIETLGATIAFQNTAFGGSSAAMMGPGIFWVKPMPSALDKIFNSLVFFRYPKIIEFGAQYFLVPLSSSSSLGPSFNATLRGKLFVKPNFFVDGAIGYRQVQFTPVNQTVDKFSTVFGTGGLGFEF
jgi:hypothetical protein